jgi:hypothetical protein
MQTRAVGWTTDYEPVAQNRSKVIVVPLLPCGNYYFSVATEYYNTNADAARTTEPTFQPDLMAFIYDSSWHDSHSP